jgi:hypothetical protein
MMKKFLATTVTLAALTTSAYADIFYQKSEKLWSVFGVVNVKEKNDACIAEQTWRDGSFFQLIKDLKDGELYIALTNNEWQIQDNPGTIAKMRANAYIGSEIYGFTFDFEVTGKNSIVIRGIIGDKFVPAFATASQLRFVMPGTIPNATIHLNGSRAAVEGVSDCMDRYKSGNFSNPLKKGLDL